MARHLKATFDTRASTGYFFCALLATSVVWIGIYAHEHWWGPMPANTAGFTSLQAWRFKLFAEGPIPYGILWAFVFGMFYLVQIWLMKFVPLGVSNAADSNIIAAVRRANDAEFRSALNAQLNEGVTGYYGHRLRTLTLRYDQDKDLSAVQAMKDDLLVNDEEDIVLSFNAVTWAEWALPMLGFLGTVVGIGEALGGIQNGVQTLFSANAQQVGMNETVLKSFNKGFGGLAVAFDTTFLGLMFLLTLGLLKVSLKKMLAKRLADARKIFFEAVSMWKSGDSSQPLVLAMGGLNLRMETLEAIVREADQRSTAFREGIQTMALTVIRENPDLKKFKDVLFHPVIQFRKAGKDLENRVSELLKREAVGATAKVTSIVPSLADPQTIALCAAIQGTTRCLLLRLTVRGAQKSGRIKDTSGIEGLLALQAPARAMARNIKGEIVVVPASGSVEVVAGDCKEDIFYPVLDGKQSEAVAWIKTKGGTSSIQLLALDSPTSTHNAETLPQDFDWRLWAVHSRSATCFAAGKRKGGGDWQLWIHNIASSKRENSPGATEQSLPAGIEPVQLAALAEDQLVILDSNGRLNYWQATFTSPVPLSHNDWAEDSKCTLRAGTKGWLAIATKDHLQMWQIGRGGKLHLYDADGIPKKGLEISGVKDPRELVVSGDGRLLLAVDKGGGIIGWEFPMLTADNF